MATTQHRNNNGGGRRSQQYSRSQRPSNPKRHSSYGQQSKNSKSAHQSRAEEELDDDIMAATFLQYCTFCEKQIVVPASSILYCSESCRKKDHHKTNPSYNTADPITPIEPTMSPLRNYSSSSLYDLGQQHYSHRGRDIIPQRSPTALNTHRFSTYSNQSDPSHFSEEEQTSSSDEQRHRSSSGRHASEAARYLRQFRPAEYADEHSSRTPRPRYNRSSTSFAGMLFNATGASMMTPSLSHSPTSTTSAIGSLPYTPHSSTRPLPPRTNPFSSTSSYTSRSIDLVTPYTHTAPSSLAASSYGLKALPISQTSMGVLAEGELMYEKTAVSASPAAQGSLKQLFRFSEMQAGPGVSPYRER